MKETNTVIVGAGPAGIAAAIQLKRADIEFVLFEKDKIGGLLHSANLVENYPGFNRGLTGTEIIQEFEKHLKELSIESTNASVNYLEHCNDRFKVKTSSGDYLSKNLIIATGTKPKKLTTCKEVEYDVNALKNAQNKSIIIVGSGDAAFDYALNLDQSNTITILIRGNKTKCLRLLYDRVSKRSNIQIKYNAPIESISFTAQDSRVKPENDSSYYGKFKIDSTEPLTADYVLSAIGREPNLPKACQRIINHFVEKQEIEGLYFAGDLVNGINRQTLIAASDGIKAALDIASRNR